MRHKFWFVILLCHCSLAVFAGPKEDAAKKRKEAESYAAQGDYSKALTAYDEAEALFTDPSGSLGRAQILMKLRRFTEANDVYQQLLATGKMGKKQKEIERAIEDLSIILATKISCSSTPDGATVYLNSTVDAPLGVTPFEQNLPPGVHRLIFQRDGFDTLSQVVTIEPKTSQSIQVTLPLKPAVISITSTPASAEISINGELKGKTPLELKLPDGAYQIVASAGGYPSQQKKLEVKAKQSYTWAIDLTKPPPGVVKLSLKPSGAIATINGETLKNNESKQFAPGKYKALISAENYKPQEKELVVESDTESTLSVELEANGVGLQVKSNRPSFVLSLNGAPIPTDAEGRVVLPLGEQRLSARSGDDTVSQSLLLSAQATGLDVRFGEFPDKKTKIISGVSAGSGLISVLFGYAGLARVSKINKACAGEIDGFDPAKCTSNDGLVNLKRQGTSFLGVSFSAALIAATSLGYRFYQKKTKTSSILIVEPIKAK